MRISPVIIIRTKCSHQQGMGDIVSSCSLAKEFRRRGHTVLFLINNSSAATELLAANKLKFEIIRSMPALRKLMKDKFHEVAILNQLNTPEEEAVIFREKSGVLVTVEDVGASAKLADLRFNVLYPIPNSFSEFKFIPLAGVFQQKHKSIKKFNSSVNRILVMQGGSDTHGFIPKILRALYYIPQSIKISVVLGPIFLHYRKLEAVLRDSPREFSILRSPRNLPDLMFHSDLAISAAGNSFFELACLGVPTVVVCAEPFEVNTAVRLAASGFGLNLGFGALVSERTIYNATLKLIKDQALRFKMREAGKAKVDGKGIQRMAEEILSRKLN